MPELPDLQVFAANLNKALAGKKLQAVKLYVKKAANATAAALNKSLKNKKLQQVERQGKELYFYFSSGVNFSVHLMLHGKLYLTEQNEAVKHKLIDLVFEGGQVLCITDFQKKARLTLHPPQPSAPDALSPQVNFKFLKAACANKKTAIKKLLMDQSILRGIGNAYADEILWAAGISPFSQSGKIPDEQLKLLARCIKTVLKDAEKQIRRRRPGIIAGEVRDFLKIHNAEKEKSPGGAPIEQGSLGGRVTYFTSEQILYQ